jgi:hypothetical protein
MLWLILVLILLIQIHFWFQSLDFSSFNVHLRFGLLFELFNHNYISCKLLFYFSNMQVTYTFRSKWDSSDGVDNVVK